MVRFCTVAVVLAALIPTSSARSQTEMLDVVPHDAIGAFMVRNLKELRTKGDDFVKEVGWNRGIRPSQLFDMGLTSLKVQNLVEETKPLGLILPKGHDLWRGDGLVCALPIKKGADLAKRFGLAKLEPNTYVDIENPNYARMIYFDGNYLYMSSNKKAIEAVRTPKPLSKTVRAEHAKRMASSDVMLYLGAQYAGDFWKNMLDDIERELVPKGDERAAAKQIVTSLRQVRYGALTLRVEKGLGFGLISAFNDDENKTVRKFLASLRSGPGTSDLKGLPKGNVLFAEGAKGDGSQSALVARLLADSVLRNAFWMHPVIADVDRHNVVNVFYEIWKRLEGNRMAMYLNAQEERDGLASIVAILDAADAKKFLGDLRILARLGDPSTLKLDAKTGNKADIAQVEQLIRDLGNDEFEVRESASTKLALLGESAIPFLKKAEDSADAEVARRARVLLSKVESAALQRRKDLLQGNFKYRLRPSFIYYPQAEKRQGKSIDVIEVKIDRTDKEVVERMQGMFGPHWDKIRVGVQGNQVVLLIGSNVTLFDRAMRNLKEGNAGLAEVEEFANSSKMLGPTRRMEAHVSVQKMCLLMFGVDPTVPKVENPTADISSFSLSIGEADLSLDLWFPNAECKPLIRLGKF